MNIARDRTEIKSLLREARCAGASIGLVPTMGYLHDGHAGLAAAARQENSLVVMSIFVNPTQFGPLEDLDRYPRDLDRDTRLATAWGVDILFVPDTEVMYPQGPESQSIWVEPGSLAEHLCGSSRPGHFRGVATVVTKLLAIIQPDKAYFGQKDGQQAIIVSRLARDLGFGVDIRVLPTVREHDGLALSSRNVYLDAKQRAQAPAVFHGLQAAKRALEQGERSPRQIERIIGDTITQGAPDVRIEYVCAAGLHSLQPLQGDIDEDALIAVAVHLGSTRLIDNIVVHTVDGTFQVT